MKAGVREAKNKQKGKGRPTKASNQNQSINSWGTSSRTSKSSPTRDVNTEVSNVENVIREHEDMAGRYVSKIFCGERIMGLVVGFDNETARFKVVYEDSISEVIDKETLVRSLAPPDLIDQLFLSHRMPRLLCILQQKVLDNEEEAGRLKFLSIENDGVDKHMIWLIELKNLFSRQLPHVPREYIVRLVLDINHKSIIVIRRNQVVGGITYRPYFSQQFAEIAFCAIMADEQIKGYGARLMNHLKQQARDVDGVTHLLTCAYNNAVDYFIKQGFTKEITLEKDQWQGYIKYYDGGILMGCELHPMLPYSHLTTMISHQRQAIDARIREVSNCEIVYPGIDFQKGDAGVPTYPIKVEDIPGLREAGWTPDRYGHSRFKKGNASADIVSNQEPLTAFMRSLLKQIYDHPDAWPFKEPVDSNNAPGYYDIIKDPMDLKTISKRVESEQYYITLEMFLADVRRMFANARTYNSPHTIYYKCATRLESFFSGKFQSSLQCSKFQPF